MQATLREVSDQTGVPYRSLQNYLSGATALPAPLLARICTIYTISADYIVHGTYMVDEERMRYAIRNQFFSPMDMMNAIRPGANDYKRLRGIPVHAINDLADSMVSGVIRNYQNAEKLDADYASSPVDGAEALNKRIKGPEQGLDHPTSSD